MEHYLINNDRHLITKKNQYAVKWEASAMQLGSKDMNHFNLAEYLSSYIPKWTRIYWQHSGRDL